MWPQQPPAWWTQPAGTSQLPNVPTPPPEASPVERPHIASPAEHPSAIHLPAEDISRPAQPEEAAPKAKGAAPIGIQTAHITAFAKCVLEDMPLQHYRPLAMAEYTGVGDPYDHLLRFENAAMLHPYGDDFKCRLFITTLSGSAQRWFNHLPVSSIRSFGELL